MGEAGADGQGGRGDHLQGMEGVSGNMINVEHVSNSLEGFTIYTMWKGTRRCTISYLKF